MAEAPPHGRTGWVARTVPGLARLWAYEAGWLRQDLVAGLVLTALLVPQGMAYAELAGLPPITGLYTIIICLVGYAVFGPSRILVLGPDSSLGPMIAATVLPLAAADGDPARAVAYASVLALLVGAITALAGVFKLGFVAELLSKPTQIGYMNGLALTIVVSQLPKLFGFSVDAENLIGETVGFLEGLADSATVGAALAIGTGSLVLILGFHRVLPRVPGCSSRSCWRSQRSTCSTWRSVASRWWGRCRRGSLPSPFPPCRWTTSGCWSSGHWGSHS